MNSPADHGYHSLVDLVSLRVGLRNEPDGQTPWENCCWSEQCREGGGVVWALCCDPASLRLTIKEPEVKLLTRWLESFIKDLCLSRLAL